MSPEEIRERYERIKSEVGPSVTVVAATKYVSVDELEKLAAARVEVVVDPSRNRRDWLLERAKEQLA